MTPRDRRLLIFLILVVGPILSLTLMWVTLPRPAYSTGSLSIPNTLANLAAGNQPLSVIDTNFSAISTYVNARELSIGALSARPSAGTSGRYYLASDVGGGTLYGDTGSTWTQLAASVTSSNFGTYGSRGLVAGNASLTTVNASATLVNLRSPTDGSIILRTATATLTNDVLTAGPVANGRDQAAQFSALSWVHVYYIAGPAQALATLSSACAPSDANGSCSQSFGPTLPTGYTNWSYIGPWWQTSNSGATAGNLTPAMLRGPEMLYTASQSLFNAAITTTEKTSSIASLTAPNALTTLLNASVITTPGSTGADGAYIRVISGVNFYRLQASGGNLAGGGNETRLLMPNVAQQFFYQITGGTPPSLTVGVAGFTVPNGGQ